MMVIRMRFHVINKVTDNIVASFIYESDRDSFLFGIETEEKDYRKYDEND